MENEVRINRGLLRWIALALGLVGLIVMAVALIATPGNRFNTVSYIALAVGVVGVVGFVLLDPQSLVEAITGRTGTYAITTWLMGIFFLVLIVGLYIIIMRANITPLDLTEAGQYKLSDSSLEVLDSLDQDVHVIGFYTQQELLQQEEAKIWLDQYSKASNGKLTYEFIDPDRDPGEAQRLGMSRSGTLVFEQADRTSEATTVSERNLTTALIRVQLGEPRIVYFVTGHGERETSDYTETGFSEANDLLDRANFVTQPLNLLQAGQVPEDADLVIVAGPQAQFAAAEVSALDAYLENGGALMVMLDPGTGGGALGNGVLDVAYGPDGDVIATAGADGTAKLWDAHTGEELLTLRGHSSDVLSVTVSADGKQVATAGRDGTVRIWDAETGAELLQPEGQTDLVRHVLYTPDGRYLVSAGEDQIVNVWDTDTYQAAYEPLLTAVPLYALVVSPDSQYIAVAGARNTATGGVQGVIYVWDASTGEELVNIDLHSEVIFDLAFSPDSETLFSVALDGTEGTLDIASGEASTVSLYPDLGITAIVVAEDGTKIFALGDGSLHIREADAESTEDDIILTGHTGQIWALALSPDGRNFVSSSRDGNARVWSLDSMSNVLLLTAHSTADQLIDYLATKWGIIVNDDIVIDTVTASAFDLVTPVMYTDASYDSTSPITEPLLAAQSRTFFIQARSIDTVEDETGLVQLTKLLFTSGTQPGDSWGETQPSGSVQFDEADYPGPVALAVSAENRVSGARMIVFGDADFVSNDALQYATYGNGELLLNAANWLTEGEVVNIPDPNLGEHLLDKPLSEPALIVSMIASICLIPGIVLGIGAVIWFVRRRRR